MTRRRQAFGNRIGTAAAFAAVLLCAAPATAQDRDVTLTSRQGALVLTGPLIGFDGVYVTVGSDYGPLTLALSAVTCDGAACPDPDAYVPTLRLSGASAMTDLLIPALIDGFARAQGWQVGQAVTERGVDLTLTEADAARAIFSIHRGSSAEGFADLIAHEADVALSLREATEEEIALAEASGAGALDGPRQARIVALDALVPVVAPGLGVEALSLTDLARAYAGEVTSWEEFGGPDVPIALHLPEEDDGRAQLFRQRVLGQRPVAEGVQRHDDLSALTTAVGTSDGGLGLARFGEAGLAQPVGLRDVCGLYAVPDTVTLKTEDYPLTAPLFLYLPERRLPQLARDFLAFTRTPEAQLIVRRAGFVDQGAVPVPLDAQGQRFVTAIAQAGPEVGLRDLQDMVRRLAPLTRQSLSFRFEAGSARLDAASRSGLLWLAAAIRAGEYDGRRLVFAGFSDGRGAAVENRALSRDRAEAVAADLRALLGEVPALIETAAFGEALPIGCDETGSGRRMNRRVELWVGD